MNKVIIQQEDKNPIDINEMINRYACSNNAILCYVTKQGTGIGIYQQGDSNHRAGFCYHSRLIHGNKTNRKFVGNNVRECTVRAIEAGREVYFFEYCNEFIVFAADYAKL